VGWGVGEGGGGREEVRWGRRGGGEREREGGGSTVYVCELVGEVDRSVYAFPSCRKWG